MIHININDMHICILVIELDRASVYRYPGNYARYLEMKEARIAADDADADRAKTKLRREALWMAKQPQGTTQCMLEVSC